MVARKRSEVEVNTVNRGLVELEVAGMQHVARRALQKHADGAGNRVVHGEKLRREAAHLHLLAGLDFDELGVFDAMLGELSLDEAERELGRINGNRAIEILQKVRDRTRVVLVAVRDDDAAQGNIRPASSTIMSFPHSNTVMFLPIASRPPRGMIFSLALGSLPALDERFFWVGLRFF